MKRGGVLRQDNFCLFLGQKAFQLKKSEEKVCRKTLSAEIFVGQNKVCQACFRPKCDLANEIGEQTENDQTFFVWKNFQPDFFDWKPKLAPNKNALILLAGINIKKIIETPLKK